MYSNRTDFINAAASEKLTLVQIQGRRRAIEWTNVVSSIYKKTVNAYAIGVKVNDVHLLQDNTPSVAASSFYYDSLTSELYISIPGGTDPNLEEIIVTYQFHFASRTLDAPYNLTPNNPHVSYEGRVVSTPGYKHKVGVEQGLTSLIGSGTLKLENNDGGLDEIYDQYIFENQPIIIYSWHRGIPIEESRIIFRGRVTDKAYTSESVSFTIKDSIFELLQQLPQNVFDENDNVSSNVVGDIKRWIYGKVDGLRLQSIDQVAEGVEGTGTLSGNTESTTVTGVGTLFLSELSPNDTIIVGTQEFTIDTITSNTSLEINSAPDFAFVDQTFIYVPEVSPYTKNREFFVADHPCAELTKTVVNAKQLNRIELSDTIGILAGDFLEFQGGERREVKNVAPGNIVVLRQNLATRPVFGSDVVRQPIQNVYINGVKVFEEDYTINNGAETTVTLSTETEFNLARITISNISVTFTNGSRVLTTVDDIDFREIFEPRDWIRPEDITYTTFYEILEVDTQSLILRTPFSEPTVTDIIEIKRPEYINDDTIVSSDVLGRTDDGTVSGNWLYTVPDVLKDVLASVGVDQINTQSFIDGADTNQQIVSLTVPDSPGKDLTKAKDVVDKLNKSISSTLTLDNDLLIKFKVLNIEIDDPVIVEDSDLVSWSIKSTNNNQYRYTIVRYRFQDVDRFTLEEGNKVQSHENLFIKDYVETEKAGEFDVYLYSDTPALIMSHRLSYFSQLSRADIILNTDLRFENIEIGDTVQLEMRRLYKRFGDSTSRKKLAVVIGKTVTGESVQLELTDLNNVYNTGCLITPNDAPDYSAATEDERLKYGYITDDQGLVEDDENTQNTNLIT